MSVYSTDSNGNARMVANVGGGGGGSADFPAGGTTGQALVKASDADNDVEWGNMPNVPIEKITVNGTEQTITNKTVAITVITETVNNLVNYYTKTETYTRQEVQQLISTASFGGFEVVATLPTTDISTRTIYLVPKSTVETSNVYDEFIYVNNSWENIGDTEIDLTVYQTKNLVTPITVGTQQYTTVESAISAINSAFASYFKTADFNTIIANYYTKVQVDAVTGDLSELETADKSSLVGAINELNTVARPRTEIEISTASDFRTTQGSYSFKTTTAVTITLADANTITIPANIQGTFDVGETDATLNDYIGFIQYTNNGYEKKIYFTSSVFYVPSTDSVQIDDNNVSSATTYSSSKIETAIGSSKASQMTGATSYQDGKAGLATQPKAGDNQKALFGDGRYHNIYSAETGSVIVAVTDEETLIGRPVTLTAGTTTLTGTFDSKGECVFNNLALYGAVQIACEDAEGNPARGSTNITYFGTYVVGVGLNFATIKFTSSDVSLAGVPVAIYKNDILVAETSLSVVGSGQLEATAYVEELGTYKAVAQTRGGTARASVTVTALRQTYTKELIVAEIYGFVIDQSDSNPDTRVKPYDLSDYDIINAQYIPAHMDYTNDVFDYGSWTALKTCDRNEIFFAPKPCMLRYDGTVDYYLDPTDFTKKIDGTASDIGDDTFGGNVMVEFPTVYLKRWMVSDKCYYLIANKQVDDDFYAYAHHDKNGNILSAIYVSAYKGKINEGKLRSISGVSAQYGISPAVAVTSTAQNNISGELGEGWCPLHTADINLINDLLVLVSYSTNSQTSYGNGMTATEGNSNGYCDNMGMFWGDESNSHSVKVFGISDWWGLNVSACIGWIWNGSTQSVKMTYGTEDGSTVEGFNLTGDGYVSIPGSTNVEGYIRSLNVSKYGNIPMSFDASATTHFCDYNYVNGSIPEVGNAIGNGSGCGMYGISWRTPEFTDWRPGSYLTYKGIVS